MHRRDFLHTAAGLTAAAFSTRVIAAEREPLFKISLAQYSLHRAFGWKEPGTADPLDFAKTAKQDFHIEAVEYTSWLYREKVKGAGLAADLKKRADDHGVRSLLIMVDSEGNLGDPDEARRRKAVENHRKWLELAKPLGCHSIRVNAASDKNLPRDEQQRLAADGLRRLCEAADPYSLNVIVENHGGLSSHGDWLAGVMKLVNHRRVGTLPDFGNFTEYDRYQGVKELMPFARGVSAKSHDFDEAGNETKTDYRRMLKIVLDAGYRGYVGIEYEGSRLSEPDGIRATRRLLEKVRTELAG
jgi:L-ribulose-5-phosphate 3-epimerase